MDQGSPEGSVWLQSCGFVPAAALVLLDPLCAEAGLFLCVVVPALALPMTQPPGSLPAHKGLGDVKEDNDPCTSIF